jgi:TetR/AcrR family transcriptional regulator, regulator of cefoperazone and chloramphenicol sensitivity
MPAQSFKKAKVAERRQSQRRILSTRAKIIEVAGRVFAEKGYEGATGKEICERAEVNPASISYHFGGMDALYHEVILEAYDAMVGFGEFNALFSAEPDPEKRLHILCELIIKNALMPVDESWELRVISREALSPSPEIEKLRKTQLIPKIILLRDLVADLLGRPVEDSAVVLGCLQVMAPAVLLQVGDWTAFARAFPGLQIDVSKQEVWVEHMFTFMLGGLRAIAAAHSPFEAKKTSSAKKK